MNSVHLVRDEDTVPDEWHSMHPGTRCQVFDLRLPTDTGRSHHPTHRSFAPEPTGARDTSPEVAHRAGARGHEDIARQSQGSLPAFGGKHKRLWYTTVRVVSMKLDVAVAPSLLDKGEVRGCCCAVIDVLRATSTIIAALANGAVAVHPCVDIAEARSAAARPGQESCLLGGEEKGQRIPGFDMGNSPLEFIATKAIVGKEIFFYTTNGTGAIRRAHARCARPVHIAALLNVSASSSAIVTAASAAQSRGIVIVCSGSYGKPSAEDIFCAGLIVNEVSSGLRQVDIVPRLTDGAMVAAGFAEANKGQSLNVLVSSEHGRFLQSIGFASDLEFASRINGYDAVPVFDGERIVLPRGTP
jgi:2-phosphosulfolactate phosphatase